MPKKQTIERARRDRREGKSGSTQAGEFCTRRNRVHPQRRARGTFDEAGDCHWSFEGEAGWRETTRSWKRERARENSEEGEAGSQESGERWKCQAVAKAFASDAERTQT